VEIFTNIKQPKTKIMTIEGFVVHTPKEDFKDIMFDCSIPCGWVATISLLHARVVGKYLPTLNNLN
jgi:hypothetical protein